MTTEEKNNKPKKRPNVQRSKPARGPRYPEGTPVDDYGEPIANAPISPEELRRIGAIDPESARATQQHRNVLQAKDKGEFVQWSTDPRIALEEIYRYYPNARLEIKMIDPHEDDNIPARPLSFIRNYDDLRRYLTDVHWKGQAATYQWFVRAPSHPQIGTGKIVFAEREDMRQGNNGYTGYPPQQYAAPPPQPQYAPPQPQYAPPPQQYAPPQQQYAPPQPQLQYVPPQQQYASPQPQQPPQQGGPVPLVSSDGALRGWMINGITYMEQVPQAQQPQQPQQPPQPPPQQAPPPAPQPPPQQFGGQSEFLLGQVIQMARENAAFSEQLRQFMQQQQQQQHQNPFMPHYPGWTPVGYGVPPGLMPMQPQQQQPQQPQAQPGQPQPQQGNPEPAPTPPSAIQVLQQSLDDAKKVVRIGKDFSDTLTDLTGGREAPAAPPAPIVQDDGIPLRTKEVEGITIGAIDGEMLGPGETAMLNAPKIIGLARGFLGDLFDRFDKVKNEKSNGEAEALARQREAVELEERRLKAEIESQREKAAFEAKRLEIKAAHVQLDHLAQQGVVVPMPTPPAPRAPEPVVSPPMAAPPEPPAPPAPPVPDPVSSPTQPAPEPPPEEPEEAPVRAQEPEDLAVPVPPNGAYE